MPEKNHQHQHHKHPLVSQDSFDVLCAVLVQVKRKRGYQDYRLAEARMDVFDVLEAIRVIGYHLVPKGVVDSIRRILGELP